MKAGKEQPRASIIKTTPGLFMVIFLSVGLVLSGTLFFIYRLQAQSRVEHLKVLSGNYLAGHISMMVHIFDGLFSDLRFLAEHHDLMTYLERDDQTSLDRLEEEFLAFSKAKRIYDQIRFLNHQGREVARINFHQGRCAVAGPEDLQDKSQRYYFKQSFFGEGAPIVLSPMDLNVEQGQVEQPLKPMIRIATAVFDNQGRKRGVVVLNYLAQHLLDLLEKAGAGRNGQTLLSNQDGYWLLGPKPDHAWGFMLPGRKDKNLFTAFPLTAFSITHQEEGQIFNREGLFTFISVYPLSPDRESNASGERVRLDPQERHCKLIFYISSQELRGYHTGLLRNLFLFGIGLLFLTAVGAWLIARSITRQKTHQEELKRLAHYDVLTDLPNRYLIFDRLDRALESGKRYGRLIGALYLDLDGFKKVNDTLGHAAGDELLVHVAARLVQTVRKSDTVGRLGGDEFMIILSELARSEDAEVVAANILEALTKKFWVEGREVTIGASIGISVFPVDAQRADQLIEAADRAMYACKERGKNCFLTVQDVEGDRP